VAIETVEVQFRESRQNLYHVPMRQWRKWTPGARQVFNEVYSAMARGKDNFLHPKAAVPSREHWKTTAWNAAWIAAGAAVSASA
jgi:hypothetical protein